MRLRSSLLLALLAAAPPTAAQTPADHDGWHLGGGVDALRFGQVVVTDAAPGVAAELRPSGRLAVHVRLGRSSGAWDVSIEANWADGHVEARNDIVSISDRTADVSRYRLALALGRRLAAIGSGSLGVELAPTLDLWSVTGESRLRAGAEGRLALIVPLGTVELEHRIGFGLSGSPIEAADAGHVADERGLQTLLIGLGLRTRL
jgi:hypothetical protein